MGEVYSEPISPIGDEEGEASIFLFTGTESCASPIYDENRAAPVTFWMCIEQPLRAFKIKILRWMVMKPKHVNFKDPIKNEEAV
jgi:hypothetical protein